MTLGLAMFILIPAFPVAVGVGCLAMRRPWVVMGIMRWALLVFCIIGLLLWTYDVQFGQHVLREFGFDERMFAISWEYGALAYVVALLMSCLSPWRRPKNKEGLAEQRDSSEN